MKNHMQESITAAGNAGALADAMEYARLTGNLPDGWIAAEDATVVCDDMWREDCTWSGTRADAAVIDDALCCPVCGGIL